MSSSMIPALGRPFDLGMLFDRRSEKIILGKTLWSPDRLEEAINIVPKPYTNSEVFIENTVEDKASALGIKASTKLSFLGGLINVKGSAKYLDDRKTSSRQSRVVLKYETTTKLKQLTMEHLGTGKVQHPEVLDDENATDVVVGILYGAKAFMVFDKEVSKDESIREVDGSMKVLVKALPGVSIDGKGSVDITENQKKDSENIQCKMYGDFRTEESPTTYEDAVRMYKCLPSLIGTNGENAVPIEVYLCPLSEINSKVERMVREISANLVKQTCEVQENIQSIEAECNDLMKEDVCSAFPRIKRQLASFRNHVNRYKIGFQKKLLLLLPVIIGGRAEESKLSDILLENERSPFEKSRMSDWIDERRNEINKLQNVVEYLKGIPFLSPKEVENEVFDPSNDHVVCCSFRIDTEDDVQISTMDDYLDGNHDPELKSEKRLAAHQDRNVNKAIRETLRHFAKLKAANEENDSVKFLAADQPLTPDFNGTLGAFIHFYADGELVNEDLKSAPKPDKLEVKEVPDGQVELSWHDSNPSSTRKYKVQFKSEADLSSDWITREAACSNEVKQTTTITGLSPGIPYLFRVCSAGEILLSQCSDVLAFNCKPTSPPGKPRLAKMENQFDAITVTLTKPDRVADGVNIQKYKLEWIKDSSDWSEINAKYTDKASLHYTVRGLTFGSYVFRATAICGDAGESDVSPISDPLRLGHGCQVS